MYDWKAWYIIGTDLIGRSCKIARVWAPAHLDKPHALKYIRHNGHMEVSDIAPNYIDG